MKIYNTARGYSPRIFAINRSACTICHVEKEKHGENVNVAYEMKDIDQVPFPECIY